MMFFQSKFGLTLSFYCTFNITANFDTAIEFVTYLIPVLAVTGYDKHWPLFLLTSSPLAKIGIIYTQVLQEENIFPVIPRLK